MIITVSSVAGAPGVTSWAMLLAAAFPSDVSSDRIVVEADIDGGVLGARYGIGVEPGLSSLISASRRTEAEAVEVESFARRIGRNVLVVPSPETAERCCRLWSGAGVAADLAHVTAADPRIWMMDIGRASASSPTGDLVARSDFSLLVTRPDQEALVQVPSRVADLGRVARHVGVLVAGKAAFSESDLATFFGTPMIWSVKADDDLVGFTRQIYTDEKSRRSLTWRAAVDIAAAIMRHASANADEPATDAPTGVGR